MSRAWSAPLRRMASWVLAAALLLACAAPTAAAVAQVDVTTDAGRITQIASDGVVLAQADASGAVQLRTPPVRQPGAGPTYDVSDTLQRWDPIYRWGEAVGTFHSRTEGFDIIGTITSTATQQLASGLIGNASTVWVGVASLYDFVLGMEPILAVGSAIDTFVADLSTAILQGPIGVAAIVVAVGAAILAGLRAGRGRPGWWRRPVSVVGLLGVVAMFGIGAQGSTITDDTYSPGVGSPGWVLVQTNGAITSLTSGLSASFDLDALDPNVGGLGAVDAADGTSCVDYLEALTVRRDSLIDARLDGRTLDEAAAVAADDTTTLARAGASRIVSGMWADTVVVSYIATQFAGTSYGAKTYCQLLEQHAGIEPSTRASLLESTGLARPGDAESYSASSVARQIGSTAVDRNLVAWAACVTADATTWTIDPGFATALGDNAPTGEDCATWWSGGSTDAFDIPADPAKALQAEVPEVEAYLTALHNPSGNWLTATMLLVGSIVGGLVLALLALGVAFAKLLGIIFTFMFFLTAIVGIFRTDGWSKLGGSFMTMLGSQLFAAAAVLLITIVLMLTRVFTNVGNSFFDAGTPFALVWAGLAPAIAVAGLHYLFTRMLRLPSPFSVKGGMAYAAAAGPAAGALTGAVTGRAAGRSAALDHAKGLGKKYLAGDDITARDILGAGTPGAGSGRSQGMDGGLRPAGRDTASNALLDGQSDEVKQAYAAATGPTDAAGRRAEAAAARAFARSDDPDAAGLGGGLLGAGAALLSGAKRAATGTHDARIAALAKARGIDLTAATRKERDALSDEIHATVHDERADRAKARTQRAKAGLGRLWSAAKGTAGAARATVTEGALAMSRNGRAAYTAAAIDPATGRAIAGKAGGVAAKTLATAGGQAGVRAKERAWAQRQHLDRAEAQRDAKRDATREAKTQRRQERRARTYRDTRTGLTHAVADGGITARLRYATGGRAHTERMERLAKERGIDLTTASHARLSNLADEARTLGQRERGAARTAARAATAAKASAATRTIAKGTRTVTRATARGIATTTKSAIKHRKAISHAAGAAALVGTAIALGPAGALIAGAVATRHTAKYLRGTTTRQAHRIQAYRLAQAKQAVEAKAKLEREAARESAAGERREEQKGAERAEAAGRQNGDVD